MGTLITRHSDLAGNCKCGAEKNLLLKCLITCCFTTMKTFSIALGENNLDVSNITSAIAFSTMIKQVGNNN